MQRDIVWSSWEQILRRWGLNELVATLLEGLGPLTLIFAQIGYMIQPFLEWTLPSGQWETMVALLEDQKSSRDFAHYLRMQNAEAGH